MICKPGTKKKHPQTVQLSFENCQHTVNVKYKLYMDHFGRHRKHFVMLF